MKTHNIWREQWTDADIDAFLEELHENNAKLAKYRTNIRTAQDLRKVAFKMVELGRWNIWQYTEWCNKNKMLVY